MCENSNQYVMIFINLMKNKDHWAPYIIYQVKGTKGIRGSLYLESNHSNVSFFVMKHMDGLHGVISELMKRQKYLMIKTIILFVLNIYN